MDKTYSILIFPHRGTRMRRLVFSKKSILFWLSGGVALLSISGWLLGDYLWEKFQREVRDLRVKAQAQREQLSALQGRAKDIQVLLANWKGLQEKVQASLPPKRRSSLNGHYAVEELETILASLQSELEHLIASIPSGWPAKGRVSSGVGTRRSPWTGKREFHSGLDIPNRVGTPVYAPGDGVVESVGKNNANGRMVVLNHGQGITTRYAHLSKTHVKKGEKIRKGQQIANIGNTGKSTSPHLHYEVRVNGIPIDPRRNLIK
ncbi:MAG: M23 family metallopeptidase [Candidatus Binatia bacterium]